MIESVGYFIGWAIVNLFFIILFWMITRFFFKRFRNSINNWRNKTHPISSKNTFLKITGLGFAFLLSLFLFMANISVPIGDIVKNVNQNRNNIVTRSSVELFEKSTDPDLLFNAGLAYLMGYAVESNLIKARELFSIAAAKGNPNAQAYMGLMCQNGLGGPKNIQMAKDFYHLAAKQENVVALCGLGALYTTTGSSKTEITEGISCLERAAKKNNIDAQCILAKIYEGNALVTRDLAKAKNYYEMAAKQNDAKAQYWLGILNSQEKNYTEAKKWLERSVDQKFIPAYTALADLFFMGNGVKKDYTQAKILYEEAAKAQDHSALTMLGVMYATGLGVTQNIDTAKMYLEKPSKVNPNIKYILDALNETKDIDKRNRTISILKTTYELNSKPIQA
jgi:TPR repeat protein